MKYIVQGRGAVNLTQQHFVASGGQGSVYAQGNTAYKIYADPTGMMPEGKIQELSPLPVSLFSRPEDIILNSKGTQVGYTSRYVKDAYVLCQTFPRSFRDRESLSQDKVTHLVKKLREGFEIAHKSRILLVDANEMNFLVDRHFTGITFIDTDSYQTRSYPATAIMESIRDRHMAHSHAFNEGTDWFSFAVTSFQMFVGIHPYKGRHPSLKGFDARMKANVSVFHKDVGVPAAAYPFTAIPKSWLGWYQAVFDRGERSPPPGGAVVVSVIKPVFRVLRGGGNLEFEEIAQFKDKITGVWVLGDKQVIATEGGLMRNHGSRVSDMTGVSAVAFSTQRATPVAFEHHKEIPRVFDCDNRTDCHLALGASKVVSYDGRVYFKVGSQVLEAVLTDMGSKVVVSTKKVASVLPNASLLFSGGVIQDMLGSTFVSLFPKSGQAYQIRVPEMDKYRVMEAKYDAGVKGGVLMVVGRTPEGKYDRLVLRFDSTFQTYDLRTISDVTLTGLNFVVTDAGVCVCLTENSKLELISVTKGSQTAKVIEDPDLSPDTYLYKQGAQVMASRGNVLYKMRMK